MFLEGRTFFWGAVCFSKRYTKVPGVVFAPSLWRLPRKVRTLLEPFHRHSPESFDLTVMVYCIDWCNARCWPQSDSSIQSNLIYLTDFNSRLSSSLNLRNGELRTQKLKSHLVKTELKRSPFKAWSRSVYSRICYAYCQEFLSCWFLSFQSIHLHFFQNLSRFFPALDVVNTASCVGP